MPRLIITDRLGQQLITTRIDRSYSIEDLRRQAEREAEIQAALVGRVTWAIAGDDGREIAAGEARAAARPGLLPAGTVVLYCETDAADAALSVYGTIAGVQAGCYLLRVDHVDSGGRPVPIGADAQLWVPVDTPPAGAAHTLEAVQIAHLVAAE